MENKINILNSAISDAQNIIKFIDTKTAFIVTIISGFVISYFLSMEKIIKNADNFSVYFWVIFIAFILLLITSIIVTLRIIKPTNNPIDNINLDGYKNFKIKYFLAENTYADKCIFPFVNSKNFKLTENYKNYIKDFLASNDNDIVEALVLELFKVNFIRNIKNDRFVILIWILFFTTITFSISYFILQMELISIIK